MMRPEGMDGATMELVKAAVRQVSEAVPARREAVLALEPEALRAVRFLVHCRVRRAYATVERISGKDGSVKPLALVKAELRLNEPRYSLVRRTVVVGLAPYLVQALASMGWPWEWAGLLEQRLRGPLSKTTAGLEERIQREVDALKRDQGAVAKVRDKARRISSKERDRRRAELKELMKILILHGWTEEEVLKAWHEVVCNEVMSS